MNPLRNALPGTRSATEDLGNAQRRPAKGKKKNLRTGNERGMLGRSVAARNMATPRWRAVIYIATQGVVLSIPSKGQGAARGESGRSKTHGEHPTGGKNSHSEQPSGGSDPPEIGALEGPTLRIFIFGRVRPSGS